MKQKLFYLLPILVLTGCGQVSYKNTSLSPEERADMLVKELTLEEKVQLKFMRRLSIRKKKKL